MQHTGKAQLRECRYDELFQRNIPTGPLLPHAVHAGHAAASKLCIHTIALSNDS